MTLFKRIVLTVKANVNSWLEEKQDPEELLEKVMEEMQQQLIAVRQAVAVAIATQKRTQREISKYENIANKYYQKAQIAVNEKQDLMAKKALKHHYEYEKHLKILHFHHQQQQEIVSNLRQQLRELEQKISAAKMKKNLYLARARTAEALSKIEELSGDLMGVNHNQVFAKMEAKVLQLEAETELIRQKNQDPSEIKFSALEIEHEIEKQLAKLKTSSPPQKL
jgi:phage shock protein A